MTTKQIAIVGAVALLTAFAVGRWSAPTKVKIQTVEVEKKTDDKKVNVDDHKLTTITETDKPDGTKVKTTTIADDRNTKVEDKKTDDVSKSVVEELDKTTSKITISALAALNVTKPGLPMYGASITRPILGPITVGIFGLQNGTAGVSVGLTF